VARKTVYNQFGTRAALLAAVLDATAERAGVARLHEAGERTDPVEAARALVAASCAFWAADRTVFRHLVALAVIDVEVGAAIAPREVGRARQWGGIVARLAALGRLRTGVPPAEATRVLAQLTGFPFYDGLTRPTGRAGTTARLLLRLAAGVVDLTV
jgi:AcrR family transcriptional regulator